MKASEGSLVGDRPHHLLKNFRVVFIVGTGLNFGVLPGNRGEKLSKFVFFLGGIFHLPTATYLLNDFGLGSLVSGTNCDGWKRYFGNGVVSGVNGRDDGGLGVARHQVEDKTETDHEGTNHNQYPQNPEEIYFEFQFMRPPNMRFM